MKKKIAILGSTGSIGRQTLDIIRKNKKSYIANVIAEIVLDKFLINDRSFN